MLDRLEQRRLLALPVSGGIVTINGTPGNDVMEIIVSGSTLQLRNAAGTVIDSASATGLTGAVVNAGNGNDFVRFGRADGSLMPNLSATIRGNPGNDTLIGTNRDDQIFGDIGDDRLDGRAGRDLLDGSSGFDTVDYSYRTVPVNVTLANSSAANDGSNSGDNSSPARYNDLGGDNAANTEGVLGGAAADRLVGSSAANWLDGGGGNDTIFGGAGIDTIYGGVNNDLAYGEGDDDYFFVKDSTGDQFLGGAGTTFANYDSGIDTAAPPAAASPSSLTSSLRGDSQISSMFGGLRSTSLAPRNNDSELALDPEFGLNGRVVTFVNGTLVKINDVAIQTVKTLHGTEEKIVVVGAANSPSGSSDFVLIRYNADGSLDTTFGPLRSGMVFTDFQNGIDSASSLVIDDKDNIIVAGSTLKKSAIKHGERFANFAIAKYKANGALDTGFGNNGRVVLDPDGLSSDAHASRIAIQQQPAGKGGAKDFYVVAGTIGPATGGKGNKSTDFGIVRLSSSGAFDKHFGLVRAGFGAKGGNDDVATGLAIDPATNAIWVAGTTHAFKAPGDFAVAGFHANGTPIHGTHTTFDFGGDDQAADAVINGTRLLVVGTSNGDTAGAIAAFDIKSISSVRPGMVLASTLVTHESELPVSFHAVTMDNSGHGVAVGALGGDFFVHRFNPADLSAFGAPAVVGFLGEGDPFDQAFGVAVQSDDKIVVAGTSDGAAAVARLQEKSFVDVDLTDQDVQNFVFTYTDEAGASQSAPQFLVQRLKALQPDGTLEVFGTDMDDVIRVTQSEGIITVDINGELLQVNAALVTRVIVHGLDGDDVIDTDGTLSVPLIFNGNGGNDFLRGGPQADVLNGGGGHDILVGRAGGDSLLGEGGFDILIGGLGSDTVRGGSGEDILIGGRTSYDEDLPSLKLILAEWTNPRHNADKRFGQLQGPGKGTGLNGKTYLKAKHTVFDDGAADLLEGGADRDWFFVKKGSDTILDAAKQEHVSHL